MAKKLVNPKQLYDGTAVDMSQTVIDTDTGLVFVSGQVDWNLQHEVTETTVVGQIKNALKNLRIVLQESGSSVDDLLHVRIYIRGELGEHMETVAPIVSDFLGASRPAITGIGVASLVSKEILVEVEAVARVG